MSSTGAAKAVGTPAGNAAGKIGVTEMTMPSDHEIVFARLLDAPRALVWKVWTDAAQIVKWWGPRGFTNTTEKMEVKPGGVWKYMMHGPDGTDYPNRITYLEVKEPAKLVYKHGGEKDVEPVNFQTTVTFEEVGGPGGKQTKLTMHALFPSKQALDFVVKTYGAAEGGKQTLARLDEYLSSLGSEEGGKAFVISRVFRAPPEVVYKAWTENEQLAKWFGPKGMSITHCTMDLRPGGVFHYCLKAPTGQEIWGRWVFQEIVPPERLVYIASFSDEKGGVTRHPMAPDWPAEMLSVVSFEPHAGIGRGTVVTVRVAAINATETEQKLYDAAHKSMTGGWGGTFEQLDEYLAKG